jgi:hypothetical protein
MITEKQFLEALEIVKAYQKQVNDLVDKEVGKQLPESIIDLDLSINAFNSLVRLFNANGANYDLINWYEVKLKDYVSVITVANLKRVRYCGPKSIKQIIEVFKEYGIDIK